MNAFASSECSSGCESGWTLYFKQSFLSANPSRKDRKSGFCIDEHKEINRGKEEVDAVEEEEEEDLSMVSDASSGPPHNFYEDNSTVNNNNGYFINDDNQYQYTPSRGATSMNKNGGKSRHRNKAHRHRRCREDEELPSFLDDTASSPLIKNNFSLTNNQSSMESVFDYHQGFPATHFQGGSAFQGHFGFFQSSPSGNQLQNNQLSGSKEKRKE